MSNSHSPFIFQLIQCHSEWFKSLKDKFWSVNISLMLLYPKKRYKILNLFRFKDLIKDEEK